MPRNPYTGVHNPNPHFPAAGRTGPFPDRRENTEPITLADGTVIPTVWTDEDFTQATGIYMGETVTVPLLNGHTINLEQFTTGVLRDTSVTTTEVMHDTSTTTAERLYAPGGGMVRDTPPASGIRVEEVTLEVPVSHDKLARTLATVVATIATRRALGYTIPEESRTVTTIGNEVVIRWEEHS